MLCEFINMVDCLDNITLNEIFILFAHTYQICFYFAENSLELSINFSYLVIYLNVLPLQFIDSFS